MPLYEYVCSKCGEQMGLMKRLADRDQDQECDSCGEAAKRVLSGFAVLGGKSGASFSADTGGRGCPPSG